MARIICMFRMRYTHLPAPSGRTRRIGLAASTRYLINSPMLPNLKNKGGSLTLYIQKETPLRTRKPTGCLHQMARFIW